MGFQPGMLSRITARLYLFDADLRKRGHGSIAVRSRCLNTNSSIPIRGCRQNPHTSYPASSWSGGSNGCR